MKKLAQKLVCFMCVLALCLAQITPIMATDGNPLVGAKNLGCSGTVSGTLSEDKEIDYYRYIVTSESSVELGIKYTTKMSASTISILDDDGNEYEHIYFSNRNDTGQQTENVSVLLNPGTYYIKIKPDFCYGSDYSMSYATKLLYNTDVNFDDSLGSAHVLPHTTKVSGILSEFCGDEIDVYRLNVDKAGVFEYGLKFYMNNLKMKLLDKDGNEINAWYFSWNDNLKMGTESFQIPLEPGVYYLEFLREYHDGKYNFEQNYTDIGSTEKEPNDLIEQAQTLKLEEKVTGMLAIGADTDFFKIDVPSKRNVTFSVPSKFKDLTMYIYDTEGNQIKSAFSNWNNNTNKGMLQKIYKLEAGTYYVQLKKYWLNGASGTYTFTVSTTKAPSTAKITSIKRTKKNWSGNRSIYLKWAKVGNVEGYQIYIAKNEKFRNADKYITDKRNYTTYSYRTGKTYYAKVRAYRVNSDGEYIYGKFSKVKKINL